MITRSLICKETPDNKYIGIYCHFDGYPDYVGKTLIKHYADRNNAEQLLALGDLSSLGERLAPNADEYHSFDDPIEDVCVAYHRDRGEKLCPAREIRIEDARKDYCAEFIYIFCLDNKWRYIDLCKEAPPTLKQIPKKFAGNYYDEEKVKLKPNSIAWEDLFQMDKNKNNSGE